MIRNPILPGFNPDPSFIRANGRWYIATSTFEWYPGVQIHVSDDLVSWELACRPLSRASQLDMRGNPDSCGVWAPCLSFADGLFWLVYTDVKRFDGSFKDAHNYIVTAPGIDGPWSDPIYVNSSGFDPSLFHDDDGRKWFLNMQWNHRGGSVGGQPRHSANPAFDGILCQEWHPEDGLLGEPVNIYAGSDLGLTEAPHLLKRNGWYYLTVAEGGTGYDHAVTMARSREINGPYETHPHKHVLTARNAKESPLQRVGHGQIAHDEEGVPWHSFLCGRPLPGPFCPLGRETGIARCFWGEDGWLYGEDGQVPPQEIGNASLERKPSAVRRIFDENSLPREFQWLRTPYPERIFDLTGQALRLTGRESIGSWFEQALVARRQEHFTYRAETSLTCFAPTTYQHAAGLTTYYNRHKFHFLAVTFEPGLGRCLTIQSCNGDWPDGKLDFPAKPLALEEGPVDLAVECQESTQQFYYRQDGQWQPFGPELNAAVLSDEGGRGEHASFTGNFVGMAAYDITGQGLTADFSRFDYFPGGW